MESAMSHPLPQAVKGFRAGGIHRVPMKYPQLPKSIPVRMRHVSYPGLMSTGQKAPATKCHMGMTMPIMTKMGGHPADTTSQLPMYGHSST